MVVHSAGIQDRDGAALVLDKIRRRFNWLELIWADGGYNVAKSFVVAQQPPLRVQIVKRTDDMKGFVVLPRRWVVERTFSWFGRNRRLKGLRESRPGASAYGYIDRSGDWRNVAFDQALSRGRYSLRRRRRVSCRKR